MKKWKGKRQKGHWMGTVAPLALGFVAVIYDQQKCISSAQWLKQSACCKKQNEISIETVQWVAADKYFGIDIFLLKIYFCWLFKNYFKFF